MDHKIYYPTQADFGVYSARRFPKGRGTPVTTPIPGIPTNPVDPNANPSPVQFHFGGAGLGLHAITRRWSYTVPLRRRAVVQSAQAQTTRISVAGTDFSTNSYIVVIRAATTPAIILINAHITDRNIGARINQGYSGPLELFEGDTIAGETYDDNAAGGCNQSISVLMIEYDALHRTLPAVSESFSASGMTRTYQPVLSAPVGSGIAAPANTSWFLFGDRQ